MSNRLNFISGIVMFVVAGTLVFVVTRDEAPAAGEEAHAPGKGPRDAAAGAMPPRVEIRKPRPEAFRGRHEDLHGPATGQARMLKAGQLRPDLRVQVDGRNLSHGDLEQRAQRVESFALRRLGLLTEELELTAEQQARIFPILARGSQSYDPRMRIVSGSQTHPLTPWQDTPASEPVDKSQEEALLQKELNPAQSDELVDQSIRDLLIWEEIIDGLAHQLDQATPGQVDEVPAETPGSEAPAEDVAVPVPDTATPPASHGGRNIFGP